MCRRSTKWYRDNEAEVMRKLGLEPTKNSGAGWVEKEDGQNDYVICQLKSTDVGSIGVKRKDLETLEYNASVSHKIPMFVLQFISDASDDIWLMVKPTDISEIVKYIETGVCEKVSDEFGCLGTDRDEKEERRMIKSARKMRDKMEEIKEEERMMNKHRVRGWLNSGKRKRGKT